MSKIFVSIANYKDPEIFNTVNELITKKSNENEIRICVFSQIDLEEKRWNALDDIPEVVHIKVDYRKANGACWARANAQKQYNGEDYFMQIDSHILFVQDWDKIVIEEHNMALGYGRKAIISCYPAPYEFNDEGERVVNIISRTKFDLKGQDDQPPYAIPNFADETDMPELQYFIAAGFFFTTGDIVENVPYDEEIFFGGEEITFTIRAYTAGYFSFSPSKYICAHLYGAAKNKGESRPLFWDPKEEEQRKLTWGLRNQTSMIKVCLICQGNWFGKYGIQNTELYWEYVKRLKIEFPDIDLTRIKVK